MHGRNHRPKGWNGPSDPGGSDPLNWLAQALAPSPGLVYEDRVRAPGNLTFYYRMNETWAPSGSQPDLHDVSGFDSTPRDLPFSAGTGVPETVFREEAAFTDDPRATRANATGGDNHGFGGTGNITGGGIAKIGDGTSGLKTLSLWFRMNQAASEYWGTHLVPMFGTKWVDSGTETGWNLSLHAANVTNAPIYLQWHYGSHFTGALVVRATSVPLEVGRWYHAAFTYQNPTLSLYLNGVLVEQGNVGSHTDDGSGNGRMHMFQAKIRSGFTEPTVAGFVDLDEVAGYRAVLTPIQIQDLATNLGMSGIVGVRTITAAYTPTDADDYLLADGTFTVTLPSAVGRWGKRYTIKNIGTGTVTVGRTGSETIDGAASNVTLGTTKMAREFLSDGNGWQITNGYL
jgi:hypothetical protein